MDPYKTSRNVRDRHIISLHLNRVGSSAEANSDMERWSGKIAVVTGASAGIGAAVCLDLAKAGLIVIGLARRVERVEALCDQLNDASGTLVGRRCDVTNNDEVKATFDWIEKEYGGVNIVVNNAGLGRNVMLLGDASDDDLQTVLSTNIQGVLNSTRAAFRHMTKYDAYGHIINVNSILGHRVTPMPGIKPGMNVYPGTKHFITATTEVLRQELNYLANKKVRVSSISPGYVDTEIFEKANFDMDAVKLDCPMLRPADISQAILFMLAVPEHVQIHEIIIKPVGEMM